MSFHISENNKDVVKAALVEAKKQALEAIGMQAENYTKMNAPVDTGRLRNSITHAQEDENTVAIGTAVEYAAYVELGTQRTAAQPYLRPAIEDHMSEYKQIAEEYIRGR